MIKLNLQLPISIFREGKHFIAYTPILDLSTSGKNYEEVKKRFKEAVSIFLKNWLKGDFGRSFGKSWLAKIKKSDGRHLFLFLKNRR